MVWRKGIRLIYSALLNKEQLCAYCVSLASMDKERAIPSHPCRMPYAICHSSLTMDHAPLRDGCKDTLSWGEGEGVQEIHGFSFVDFIVRRNAFFLFLSLSSFPSSELNARYARLALQTINS